MIVYSGEELARVADEYERATPDQRTALFDRDMAIALAVIQLDVGDRITLHHEDCPVDETEAIDCACESVTYMPKDCA